MCIRDRTTIVNLISRFYNLNGGRLLIDGIDISDVTLKSLRSQMGIMLQDSVIFSGSIRDNIRYGRLDATNEEIEAACKVVGADEFINEMPDGYDTFVKERGSSLSQGQRQMIAFARTILADPKILVLDEGTIVGKGTHKELMQTCEEYRQIAESQLSPSEIAASLGTDSERQV